MTELTNFHSLLNNYHGDANGDLSPQEQRKLAVSAALSILQAHAAGGTGSTCVSRYKDEVPQLADAIQEALKYEE